MVKLNIVCLTLILSTFILVQGCSNLNRVTDEQNSEFVCETLQEPEASAKQAFESFALSLDTEGDKHFLSGQYANASVCYTRGLKVREQRLGRFHPSMIDSLNNLATLHEAQSEYSEASILYKRALQILKRQFQKQNSSVKNIQGYQAAIRFHLSSQDSLEKIRSNLIAYKQIFGGNNVFVGTNEYRLAVLYLQKKDYPASEKAFKTALLMIQQNIGPDHPYYAKLLVDYAQLMRQTNRELQAEQLEQKADSILIKFPKKRLTPLYQ